MTLGDEEIIEIWRKTPDYDAFLRGLRERGLSKLDSIKALRQAFGIPLAHAKQLAGTSEVWRDGRDETERLHDAVEDAMVDGQGDAD